MKKRKSNYGINPDTGKPFRAQWEVLYHYLKSKSGRTITQAEATTDFGFTDLAGVIKRIEEHTGVRAQRRWIDVPTRYGGVVTVKQYWIEQE